MLDGGLKPTPVEIVNTDYANIMQHLGGPRPVLLGSQARQSHRLLVAQYVHFERRFATTLARPCLARMPGF